MFEELVDTLEKPPAKERPEKVWVCPGTWSLVEKRAELRKAGRLTQREARRLAHVICASLKLDRQERAWKVGEAIMMELLAGNIKEAWRILKAWHRDAGGAATKPCYASMERQTVERENFYAYQALPGEHIPSNRDPVPLPDKAPPDADIRTTVKVLRNGRTGAESRMRAEHLKAWLPRAEEEE